MLEDLKREIWIVEYVVGNHYENHDYGDHVVYAVVQDALHMVWE